MSRNEPTDRGQISPGTVDDDRRAQWQGQHFPDSHARDSKATSHWNIPSRQSPVDKTSRPRSADSHKSDAQTADVLRDKTTLQNPEVRRASNHLINTSHETIYVDPLPVVHRPDRAADQLPHESAFDFAVKPFLEEDKVESLSLNLPTPTESELALTISNALENTRSSTSTWTEDFLEAHMLSRIPRPIFDMAKTEKTISDKIRYLTVQTALTRCSVLIRQHHSDFGISNRTERSQPADEYSKIRHIVSKIALPLAKGIGNSLFEARSWYWRGRGTAGEGDWEASRAAFQKAIEIHPKKGIISVDEDVEDLHEWLKRAEYEAGSEEIARQKSYYEEQNPGNHQQMVDAMRAQKCPIYIPKNWDFHDELRYIESDKFLLPHQRAVLKLLDNRKAGGGEERSPASKLHRYAFI